jgi:hypothetical protein
MFKNIRKWILIYFTGHVEPCDYDPLQIVGCTRECATHSLPGPGDQLLMSESGKKENDPFRPPPTPTQVHCLHCGMEYESYMIYWEELDTPKGPEGFWCCPTAGCDGKGFGFDIFPTDPEYRDEQGNLMWIDDGFEDSEEEDVVEDEGGDPSLN